MGLFCVRCGSPNIEESIQEFRDKTRHIKRTCGDCGKFIDYKPQTKHYVLCKGENLQTNEDVMKCISELHKTLKSVKREGLFLKDVVIRTNIPNN